MSDPTQDCMPECMMPDGGAACLGYQELIAKTERLTAENSALREEVERLKQPKRIDSLF